MLVLSNPSPQWVDESANMAAKITTLVPYNDPSGFWTLRDDVAASGAYLLDASGFVVIDTTTTIGLTPTLLPSSFVVLS